MARITGLLAVRTAITLLIASPSIVSAAAVPESVDVVVVGAGLAGLTAARDLLAAGKTVRVLEARDRVGGKVHNAKLKNGGVTEVGAEFVGPTQDHVLKMISDLGLETFKTYNEGNSVLWRNGTRLVYTPDPALGGSPPVAQEALIQIAGVQQKLNEWTGKIDVNAPWNDSNAAEWDKMSFQDFLNANAPHPDAQLVLTSACKGIFSAEPRDISLLYLIAYIASGGNETTRGTLASVIAVQNGAQESRVVGGTGLIPERLAEKVGSKHITLNAAVSSIKKTPTGYVVESCAGSVQANRVVVAMPPPLLKRIAFSPALPQARQNLIDGLKLPAIGKGIAVYKTPFWRTTEKLDGQVVSDSGSVKVTLDSSESDGKFGAILGFILGDEMRALDKLPAEQAQKMITSDYVRYFGSQAADTTEFVLQRWDLEEFSKGGPVAVAPPGGVLSKNGHALREAVDGIHFAGTETSVYWTGYMDGAIRSGERVAKEILGH
ncbi:amine oxidase [Parastagonospora nodorum]|nr:amine oxidase [Parastagonospora nodorum]KAH6335502.1 amine oxidase [Parastagonospora nodorum]KAH6349547.1 amine oxidase [Parastagonospora nodorum]